MREPGNRDPQGRDSRDEPRREQGTWQGQDRQQDPRWEREGRQSDHRWAADERDRWSRDLPNEESWSRPGTGESLSSTGYRGRQRFGEQERFNEFEDQGFSGGAETGQGRGMSGAGWQDDSRWGRERSASGRPEYGGGYAGATRGGYREGGGERFGNERFDNERFGNEPDFERGRDRSFENLREREQNTRDRGYAARGRNFETQESAPVNWPGPRDFLNRIPRGDYASVGFVGGGAGTRTDYTPTAGRGMSGDLERGARTYGEPGRERQMGGRAVQSGPHFGRGPKNYRRSDERLSEEICDLLMQHPNIDASDVEVEVREGEVVLRGKVDDRQTKHRIEDLVDGVMGVRDIRNEMRVERGFWSGLFGGREEGRESGESHDERPRDVTHERHFGEQQRIGGARTTPGATLTGTDATASSSPRTTGAGSAQSASAGTGDTTGATGAKQTDRPTGRGSRKEQ